MAESKKQKVVRIKRVKAFEIRDFKIVNYFLLPSTKSEVEDMVMKDVFFNERI